MRVVRVLALLAVATVSLTACYVVPVTRPDGAVVYQPYPLPAPGTVIPGTAKARFPRSSMPNCIHRTRWLPRRASSQVRSRT